MTSPLMNADKPQRYDTLTRLLHWLMAAGFIWVLSSALAHKFMEESALDSFLWPTHKPAGLLLISFVVLRLLWVALSFKRRPAAVSVLSSLGHLGLYVLMFAVPFMGLLRQYGSGRAFEVFGVQVMAATPEQTYKWMVEVGGTLHSPLGWLLLALIIGHIAAVIVHRRNPQTDVLPRMLG